MGSGEVSTMRNFIVCTVPHIVRLIKSRRLRWAGNVVRMEEGRSAFKILAGKPTGKDVCQLFIDFEKAYDSIKRESLYDILIKFGVPKK